jgi:hypothetical protein
VGRGKRNVPFVYLFHCVRRRLINPNTDLREPRDLAPKMERPTPCSRLITSSLPPLPSPDKNRICIFANATRRKICDPVSSTFDLVLWAGSFACYPFCTLLLVLSQCYDLRTNPPVLMTLFHVPCSLTPGMPFLEGIGVSVLRAIMSALVCVLYV